MINHITKYFRFYLWIMIIMQILSIFCFFGFGFFGMWFFSLLSLIVSFGIYIIRLVIKKHVLDNLVHRITKKRDPLAVLEHMPLDGRARRRIIRKHELKPQNKI